MLQVDVSLELCGSSLGARDDVEAGLQTAHHRDTGLGENGRIGGVGDGCGTGNVATHSDTNHRGCVEKIGRMCNPAVYVYLGCFNQLLVRQVPLCLITEFIDLAKAKSQSMAKLSKT